MQVVEGKEAAECVGFLQGVAGIMLDNTNALRRNSQRRRLARKDLTFVQVHAKRGAAQDEHGSKPRLEEFTGAPDPSPTDRISAKDDDSV